jgi:hypothetical protein
MNRGRLLPPFLSPEFLGDLRIAETILVEVKQVQVQPVLHLAFAQIVKVRLPVAILRQIFRHVRRQKNVSGVTAVQHSLRNIDSRTRYIRFLVNIDDSVDRTTVDSHSQPDARMMQLFANLERTLGRFFRTVEENQCHAIAGRHSDEFTSCFCSAKTFRTSHDSIQFLEQLNLLVVR